VASAAPVTHPAKRCHDPANDCELKVLIVNGSTGPRLRIDPDFVAITENRQVPIKWVPDDAAGAANRNPRSAGDQRLSNSVHDSAEAEG
jgi:hypothetical protein